MWSIDTKIKMMKRSLPKWLQQEKYESYYDSEKRKVVITYLLKDKNQIIFEVDLKGMTAFIIYKNTKTFFNSKSNLLGFFKPPKPFLKMIKLLSLKPQI